MRLAQRVNEFLGILKVQAVFGPCGTPSSMLIIQGGLQGFHVRVAHSFRACGMPWLRSLREDVIEAGSARRL